MTEKACRRAGLDYWPRLGVSRHRSWPEFLASARPPRLWLFSTKARRPVFDVDLRRGDHLVFGKETAGLPSDILAAHPDRLVYLPMVAGERSLNLATAVCAAVYEGIRQMLERREISLAPDGRLATLPP